MLHQSYRKSSDKELTEFEKNVIRRNNTIDNMMRYSKKVKDYKSDSAANSDKKYKFYEQLPFVNKTVDHRPTETSMPLAEDIEENPVPIKKMKQYVTETDQLERKIPKLVDSVEKDDQSRIMSFFRGIAPTIEKFNDADIVEFQYEVIKAMKNISQRTQTPYLQHVPRNYFQNISQPAQLNLSHPSYVAPNINENPHGDVYRNYNINESKKVHQYITPDGKRSPEHSQKSNNRFQLRF